MRRMIMHGVRMAVLVGVIVGGGVISNPMRTTAATTSASATSNLQTISPSTCDYSTPTDFFCTLPPGSTIKLPMSAPAVTPSPGWYCVAGDHSPQISYYGGPSATADMTVQWVPQSGGACGKVSGYALVTIGPKATPQYLATDFYLSNDVGECESGTNPPLCTNGIADNGTRWSLNISLPQYVMKYSNQVVTPNFPNGTTPYVFPDYPPPAGSPPQTNAATVTCAVSTKVIPTQNQISYSGNVSCNSPNGIVGRIAFNVYRIWQDRTDSDGGGVLMCSQQSYQSTCQTPTYTFPTYGNNPAVYKIAIDVDLLNPINGEGLPGNVIQYTGANYQMVPYNNTNTPYPLVNPEGWNNHHLPFPDTETLPTVTYCPTAYQGSSLYPQCSAYNTPQLRSNAITTYGQNGYAVPAGVTPTSSGQYITQYIKPIECGGGIQGPNGVFLKPGMATQFSTWWNNFSPCAPQPPSAHWQTPKNHFTVHVGDTMHLAVTPNSGSADPTSVTFTGSYPGYTDPTNPQNHSFPIATVSTGANNVFAFDWNQKTPDGQVVPSGSLTITATACTSPDNCASSTITGQVRQRLFLFLLGLNAGYDPNGTNGLQTMQSQLLASYPGSDSKFFIYPCGADICNGTSYPAAATCSDTIWQDINALNVQIHAYSAAHVNTDIYLVSHSLGGMVAFGYLAHQKAVGWPNLSNSNQLHGVVTMDSPLGGIPAQDAPAVKWLFSDFCYGTSGIGQPVAPLNEFTQLGIDSGSSSYFGGSASLYGLLYPNNSAGAVSNDALAADAVNHGMWVLSVGNLKDYGYALGSCTIGQWTGLIDFTGAQFLSEIPTSTTNVYSRYISDEATPSCTADAIGDSVNHGLVTSDPNVIQSVIDLVAGNNTLPLPVYRAP